MLKTPPKTRFNDQLSIETEPLFLSISILELRDSKGLGVPAPHGSKSLSSFKKVANHCVPYTIVLDFQALQAKSRSSPNHRNKFN